MCSTSIANCSSQLENKDDFAMCALTHVCSELELTALPTPVFSAQNDTDAHVPWRFGAKHSVQHPASPPFEEHPILLWCTETRPKPSSLNSAQPMLQALSPACMRQAVPTCRARTNIPNHLHQSSKHHPGCSHRLSCCYQPSNNRGTKETTDKNNPGTNTVTRLVINTQTRCTLMLVLTCFQHNQFKARISLNATCRNV